MRHSAASGDCIKGVMTLLFYDFEVFKCDWLVVVMDTDTKKTTVIINDKEELTEFFVRHQKDIWVGFNNVHYDQYIMKAVLLGCDPKRVNDYIIVKDLPGWKYSPLFNRPEVAFINYDVMLKGDRGLKSFEGFMGSSIKESSVPFDIDRKLTDAEIRETVKYCKHDVEQTLQVFLKREADSGVFQAHMGLVKLACQGKDLNLMLLSKTKAQLSAIILEATRNEYNDEFDFDLPDTMRIEKYTHVVDWYMDEHNHSYTRHVPGKKTPEKVQLKTTIAGVPHVFGWGGVHGALEKYHKTGYFINMDVASLYPSLMIQYNLGSRSMKNPKKYEEIYHQRLKYKREKNPLQAPLKLVLNSTYGVMKDKNNALYDPRQANSVCVYGQLLLLDLIERLESYAEIVQSNTDGVLIRMPEGKDPDKFYSTIDDIAYDWEKRVRLKLEFDEYVEIYQKDVNNYVIIAADGHYKSKGKYVKELSSIDYDLPILNKALINYMVYHIPIETTINGCDDLKEFQYVTKITSKYSHILHGDKKVREKCIRVFASTRQSDKGVYKVSVRTGKPAKIPDSPDHCFIQNSNVNSSKVPYYLDKEWYIKKAYERLKGFGV